MEKKNMKIFGGVASAVLLKKVKNRVRDLFLTEKERRDFNSSEKMRNRVRDLLLIEEDAPLSQHPSEVLASQQSVVQHV